jgi:phosphomannomutase
MTDEIVFGTDGWRARIADGYTFANLRRVAAAAARYYADECDGRALGVVVGHDRRFLSSEFAQAAAEVLAGHGIPVWLTAGPTPTPVISYSVLAREAAGAVNLTASHNPAADLGFKVRDRNGAALAPEALHAVESRIPPVDAHIDAVPFDEAVRAGIVRTFDPADAYRAYVARQVDLARLAGAGLRVAYDPMWGAGLGWLEWLLGPGARTRFSTIHGEPNPTFPDMVRPEPIQVASFTMLLREDINNLSFKFDANPFGSLSIASCAAGYPVVPVTGRVSALNY